MAALGNFYAGTSGRIAAVAVTPVLTTDVITWGSGATTVWATFKAWAIQIQRSEGKILTFESDGDVQGSIWPGAVRGGVGGWTARLEGITTGTSGTSTWGSGGMYMIGTYCLVDFIWKKLAAGPPQGKGFLSCHASIKSLSINTGDQEPFSKFSMELDGYDVLPDPTY